MRPIFLLLLTLAVLTGSLAAQVTLYTGSEVDGTNGIHTSGFFAARGAGSKFHDDLEAAPLGITSSLQVGNLASIACAMQHREDGPWPWTTPALSFRVQNYTTQTGSNRGCNSSFGTATTPDMLSFEYSVPIAHWGAHFFDCESDPNDPGIVRAYDGNGALLIEQDLIYPNGEEGQNATNNAVNFVGLISTTANISVVTVTVGNVSGAPANNENLHWIGYLDVYFGSAAQTNKMVLPDTHHLMERGDQHGSVGSSSFWSTGPRHFQILYEASHFVGHGVTGPITIEGLCFRGEDGEPNAGGNSWANAQVRVGATSLDHATFSTTFATNVAGATTTMGATGTINVVETASSGATPNNFNIVLDLASAGASFTFDPTSGQPSLLIDIVLPNGASSPPMMRMQDTTGSTAGLRGTAITGSSTATTGFVIPPLVVGVQFDGSGGYEQPTPARNEFYGAACGGSPSSFYQSFLPGQPFDVTGLTLTPDTYPSPNTYTVSAGAPPVDATQANASPNTQSDDEVVNLALGFTFEFPGGSTTSIGACTNGYVWLNGSSLADFRPSVPRLLGDTGTGPRLAPCWYDLHAGRNASLLPNSGLHVRTAGSAPNRVAYVTWLDVGIFNSAQPGAAVHRMQCAIYEATGVVEFRYGNMPSYCANSSGIANPAVVGFSRGEIASSLSVDPQTRDLSHEVPFTTSLEGTTGNMGLRAVATPIAGGADYSGRIFTGQSITWDVVNVPAGATIGAMLLDFTASTPGLSIPGIHAPGCVESTTINPLLWEIMLFPGSTVTGNLAVDIAPGYHPDYTGFKLYAQFVLLDLSGGPSIVTASSNAIKHTVGGR